MLLAPFTETELLDVFKALPKDRYPGENDPLLDFFLCHWDLLKERLQLAFQEIMDEGSRPKSLTQGLSFLVPNERGDWDEI